MTTVANFRMKHPPLSTHCGYLTQVPVSQRLVIYLCRWHTHFVMEGGRGLFPGCKHTVNLKGPGRQRSKRETKGGRGPMAPSGSWRRQSPRKCRRRQPCRRGTNYRLDCQVTITWTCSLSLPLFSFWFSVSRLSRLCLVSFQQHWSYTGKSCRFYSRSLNINP